MAFTYSVSYSTSANGPWTGLPGSPFSSTSDVVTGLNPSTAYWFQIITNDTATGVSSAPLVNGPFTTTAAGPTESIDGTFVTAAGQQIFASRVIGSPSSGPFDVWEITGPGGQAILNGVTRTDTASVSKLAYYSHKLYQTSPNGNSLNPAGPGWWQWNGTGWTDVTDPTPLTPVININTIANQFNNTGFTVSGTLTNYTTVPTLQYMDGTTNVWNALPTGATVSTTTFSFTHPVISTATTSTTVSVRDANNTTISKTSNTFAVSVPGVVTLNDIILSNSSVAAGVTPPVTVGTISVNTTGGNYIGQTTLSGADQASFSVVGNTTLQTAASLTARTYNINLVATQTGAVNSPLIIGKAITATSGPPSGPGATSTFLTVDFTNMVSPGGVSNVIVAPQLFGVATGGMFTGGGGSFNWITNGTWRNLVRALNLPLFRLHGGYINGTGDIAPVVSNIAATVPSTCTMVVGVNNNADAQGISAFWKNNSPIPATYWEIGNEFGVQPSGLGGYSGIFTNQSAAIHRTDATFKVGGPVWAGFDGRPANQGGVIAQLIQQNTASTLGFLDYHQYAYCQGNPAPSDDQACLAITPYDQNGGQTVHLTPNTNQFPQMTTQLQAYTAGTYAANYPVLLGEYNIECSAGSDTRAHSSIGAAFLCSCLLGFASTSTQPCWGAMWDLADDDGAGYDMIDSGLNTYPQYWTMQQLIARMPGAMVNSSTGSTGGGLQCWGTKSSGTSFGVAIVNSTGSAKSGPVALSHWPVNTTGNGTVNVWSYPQGGGANTPGSTTTATVTAGVVNVNIPGHSCAIIYP